MKLKVDSRDLHAHALYGQIAALDLPDESNFGFDLTKVIEGAGEVDCTAISTTKAVSSQTKVQYDVQDLWSKVPNSAQGADPRETLGTVVKNGLLPLNGGERYTGIKGYFRGDTGAHDAFDNTRSAMLQAKSSITVASGWYAQWSATPPGAPLPAGINQTSNHDYEVLDWKLVGGEPMFVIDAHEGFLRYMPRDTFNAALNKYGCATWMPATQTISYQRTKTIWEFLKDTLINLGLSLKQWTLVENSLNAGFPPNRLLQVAKASLGKKMTLNADVPPEVSCGEALSAMLQSAGVPVPQGGIAGTSAMDMWLSINPLFEKISEPEAGAVVVSATDSGNGTVRGHCGIFGGYNVMYHNDFGIVSNNSQTGLVGEQWNWSDWQDNYIKKGNLRTNMYRLK